MKEKFKQYAVMEWLCAFAWLICWGLNGGIIYFVLALWFAGVATYRMRAEKKQ